MPLLSAFWSSARPVAPAEAGGVDERKQVGLVEPEWLRDVWREGGLGEVSVGELITWAEYDDYDDLWFSFEQGVGRSGSVYLSLDADRRTALRSRAQDLLGSQPGSFRLEAGAWFVRGIAA